MISMLTALVVKNLIGEMSEYCPNSNRLAAVGNDGHVFEGCECVQSGKGIG